MMELYNAAATIHFDPGIYVLSRYAVLLAFFTYATVRFLAKVWPF